MRRALVGGAGGFIGSHLARSLVKDGYGVRGVDLKLPEFSQTGCQEFVLGDLRDQAVAKEAVDGIDDVYQLAADVASSEEGSAQAGKVRPAGGRRLKGIFAEGSAEQPLVTVITPIFNGKPYVAGCLESVLRQDYPNIEHIVLDGASNDGTVDVLREYDDRIALWRSEPDAGLFDAWNKALDEARGEWICFLGVDDEFLLGAISAYMALAAKNPDAEYLSSRARWVHPSGYEKIIGDPWTWREFSKHMCIPHVGSMHRRSLFDRLGRYDTSYPIVADYELLLRARNQLHTAYMPVVTVMIRGGGTCDRRIAFLEQARAKVATGGRNKLLAALELCANNAKYALRPLRYALARMMQPR